MHLSSTTANGAQIITVRLERIDAAMAIQFKEEMRCATNGGADQIILDLSDVAFIDSSGLGAIVAAMKQLGGGRRMDLAGLTPAVDKVLCLTRMDTVFNLFSTLDEAKAAITG